MRLTAVRNDESEAASFRHPLLEQVSAKKLRATVEALNYPRLRRPGSDEQTSL